MRPEARPIEFINGHAHFYGKKKVDILQERKRCKLNWIASKTSELWDKKLQLPLFLPCGRIKLP